MKITKRQLRRMVSEVWTGSNMGSSAVDSKVKTHMERTDQPKLEADDASQEDLTEYDEWGAADSAAEKDAFLDSMVEMWLDHLGMSGIDRVAVIQALNNAYLSLTDESR